MVVTECPTCGQNGFSNLRAVKSHHTKEHDGDFPEVDESSPECPTCGRDDFNGEHGMMVHHVQTHGESLASSTGSGPDCPTCGRDDFGTKTGMHVHHAQVHGESLAGVTLECEVCGKDFQVNSGHEDGRTTCSQSCQNKLRAERDPEPVRLSEEQAEAIAEGSCPFCSAEFASAHAVKSHTPVVHEKSVAREIHVCEECDDEYVKKRWELNSNDGARFCSYDCMGTALSVEGEEHPMYGKIGPDAPTWKGGRDLITAIRGALGPRPWPEISAIYRDQNDECELCGKDDCRLEVHHIVPTSAGGTNGEYNLMSLCATCHKKAEAFTGELFPSVYVGDSFSPVRRQSSAERNKENTTTVNGEQVTLDAFF